MTQFVISKRGGRTEMVVTGEWTKDAQQALVEGRVDRIVLNYALGFSANDLEFMRSVTVDEVEIVALGAVDLSPLYDSGAGLKVLHLTTMPDVPIDLARFPRLTELAADWSQVSGSVGSIARLRTLFLTRYLAQDLGPLKHMASLVDLTLKDRPRIRTLSGVESLTSLESLRILGARDLADIRDVIDNLRMRHLEIEGAVRISDLEPLRGCRNLTLLNISECGDIKSSSPIRSLRNLEILDAYGSTKFIDGDLEAIATLPHLREIRMQDRRHYRPRLSSFLGGTSTVG